MRRTTLLVVLVMILSAVAGHYAGQRAGGAPAIAKRAFTVPASTSTPTAPMP